MSGLDGLRRPQEGIAHNADRCGDTPPPTCSPVWRSLVHWHSDIEDIMDRIANEAMGYHPDSRAEFFSDVVTAINEHRDNAGGMARELAAQDSESTTD